MQRDRELLASLQECGGITAAEAAIVLEVYRKMGLVTSKGVPNVPRLGAYLDRDVIRHALAQAKRVSKARKKK